jgi:hypothetical protein
VRFSNWAVAHAGGRSAIPVSPISSSAAPKRSPASLIAWRIACVPIGRMKKRRGPSVHLRRAVIEHRGIDTVITRGEIAAAE